MKMMSANDLIKALQRIPKEKRDWPVRVHEKNSPYDFPIWDASPVDQYKEIRITGAN